MAVISAVSGIFARGYDLCRLWLANGGVPFMYISILTTLILSAVRTDYERNTLFHTTLALTKLVEKDE